jgi:hypothetical protein
MKHLSRLRAAVGCPRTRRAVAVVAVFCAMVLSAWGSACAGDDKELEEMQKKLNSQVMEKPFSVEEVGKINAYIEDAMKKDLKPQQTPPPSWRTGYTCANLHDYYEYRNCLYYHRYYGHYW